MQPLSNDIHLLRHWLVHECQLQPGNHVAMLLGNRMEFINVLLAGICAGVYVAPVNWHLTPDDIRTIIIDSNARVLVTESRFATLVQDLPVSTVFINDVMPTLRTTAVTPDAITADLPAGGTLLYTSGTTGKPKGVKRFVPPTLDETFAAMRDFGKQVGMDGNGVHLVTGPLYHAAPGLLALYDFLNGAQLVLMPQWDAREFLRLVQQHRVTHTHLVPTTLLRLLQLPEAERNAFDISSLTCVMHGAAPIAPAIKQQLIDWLGPIVVEYWGGTETGVLTLATSAEWLAHPGTVGKALPQYTITANAEGELFATHAIRGVMPALGDMGRVDADGFVYLTDRKHNMIISGGVNIYPAEIEHVLITHPAVQDVAVFGQPDAEWGERTCAAVVLHEGFAADDKCRQDLVDYCAKQLARFKLPRHIVFLDVLPRLPSGKVQIQTLRNQVT